MESDIAIIGAGFSGSLLSLLLKRIGIGAVLIDRGTHPRFAIGESSTPTTNMILEDLSRRYDLPRIAPLATYGAWKRACPQVVCGLKRGFSYVHHELDRDFQPRPDHANELLVASSEGVEDGDTHWLRSDFDKFINDEAIREGIPYFDQTSIDQLTADGPGWRLRGTRLGESLDWKVRVVIDASGDGGFLSKQLGIKSHPGGLQTRSRSLFSHFTGVKRWQDLYAARGGRVVDHPYPCDDAALHHVFDGGWMWVLPFDNGVTSAGFSLDPDLFPLDRNVSPEEEWQRILKRLPAVREQFAEAVPVVPWRQTGPIQRRLAQAAGPNWLMLPNTAAFHDPFFSTGNSYTLVGIERLMTMLERSWNRSTWADEMIRYNDLIQREAEFIDLIVSGSFAGFREFPRMVAMSMFYFVAATWTEIERRSGRLIRGAAFLSADHQDLRRALERTVLQVRDPGVPADRIAEDVRSALATFNRAGLCDPARRNLYPIVKAVQEAGWS